MKDCTCGNRPRLKTVWFHLYGDIYGDKDVPAGYYVYCPYCGMRTREVSCSKAKTPNDRKKSIDVAEKEWDKEIDRLTKGRR